MINKDLLKKIGIFVAGGLIVIFILLIVIWQHQSIDKEVPIAIAENVSNSAVIKSNIYVLGADGLHIYGHQGKEESVVPMPSQNRFLKASKKKLYVVLDQKVQRLSTNGVVEKEVEIPFPAKELLVGEKGVAVMGDKMVIFYNKDLESVYEFVDNVSVTQTTMNPTGELIAISWLEEQDGRFKSQSIMVDQDGDTWKTNFADEVIFYQGFTKNDELIILTNQSLYVVREGLIVKSMPANDIVDIQTNGSQIYVLKENAWIVLDNQLNLVDRLTLSNEYDTIYVGKEVWVKGKDKLSCYHQKALIPAETQDVISCVVWHGHCYGVQKDRVFRATKSH